MFVRLDNGPSPVADIIRALEGAQQGVQQGFQNALGVAQVQDRRAQVAAGQAFDERQFEFAQQRAQQGLELQQREVAAQEEFNRGRLDVMRQESSQRIVRNILGGVGPSRGSVRAGHPNSVSASQMIADLQQNDPELLEQVMAPFRDLPDPPEGQDPLSTIEGAESFAALSGAYAQSIARRTNEAAQGAARTIDEFVADPRTGITEDDAAEFLGALQAGDATPGSIQTRLEALRARARKGIGFHELRQQVLSEASTAFAAAASKGGGALGLPGESTPAEQLAELRGAIDTAGTPGELMKARGAFLIKAYGLDGVVEEAEIRAGEAARAAMEAEFAARIGDPAAFERFLAAQAGVPQVQGFDPEAHPGLAKQAGRAAQEPEESEEDKELMRRIRAAGFDPGVSPLDLPPEEQEELLRIADGLSTERAQQAQAQQEKDRARVERAEERRYAEVASTVSPIVEDALAANPDATDASLASAILEAQDALNSEERALTSAETSGLAQNRRRGQSVRNREDAMAIVRAYRRRVAAAQATRGQVSAPTRESLRATPRGLRPRIEGGN